MFYVYILQSKNSKDLYVGQTKDIQDRLIRHNRGDVNSTKAQIPWEMVCLIHKNSRSEAMKLEKYLKSLGLIRKLEFIEKYGIEKI